MLQKQFNTRRTPLRFKQFNRKGYSLFAALGKEVLIGVLSVSTLTYAKASGISTDTQLEHDSLSREEVKLDEVIVSASRAPLTALQSAKIVAVISHDDILRAEATSINDVLKLATGVDVRQRGGFGVQTDISINGGTFDQITILLNGVNLSNPQTGHNAADFPVSLADIDHIEVLEGASARVFGSSAFSGAINIVTRPEATTGVRIGTEGGSYGTWGAEAAVSLAPTKASLRLANQLSAGFTRSDGGTENSDFRKRRMFYQGQLRTAVVSLDWQAGIASQDYGANTFYSAKYNNQYEETRRYMGSLAADIAPWARTGGTWLSTLHL